MREKSEEEVIKEESNLGGKKKYQCKCAPWEKKKGKEKEKEGEDRLTSEEEKVRV